MPTINGGACVVNGAPVDKVFSNELQGYGRNWLKGTSSDLQTAPESSGLFSGGKIYTFGSGELSILAGNQVTVRAFINNTTTHTVNLVIWTDGGGFGIGTDIPAGTDGYSTITSHSIPANTTRGDINIRAYTENASISGVQYKELKLEKGSVATPWIGVQVYGRNWLKGTSSDLQTASDSSSKDTGGQIRAFSSDYLSILAGSQITVRAFINNTTTHTVNLVIWTDGGGFGIGTDIPAGTDGYSTITSHSIPANTTRGDINIRAYTENAAISGVQYKELKLEKGSVATPWTPAPEDVM